MEAGESMSLQKRVEQTSGVVSKCEGGDLSPRRRQGKVSESAASVSMPEKGGDVPGVSIDLQVNGQL